MDQRQVCKQFIAIFDAEMAVVYMTISNIRVLYFPALTNQMSDSIAWDKLKSTSYNKQLPTY